MPTVGSGRAKARDEIGAAITGGVAQQDEVAARRTLVAVEVRAAPRVDVHVAICRNGEVPWVSDAVREDCRAEAGGERETGIVARAAGVILRCRRSGPSGTCRV